MKKLYTEPELEIRKYSLSGNGVMTKTSETFPEFGDKNDLNKDDSYDNIIG